MNQSNDSEYVSTKLDRLIDKIENRTLARPDVKMRHLWTCLIILIVVNFAFGLGVLFIPVVAWIQIIIYLTAFVLFNEFYLRFFGVILIKCYQHYATYEMRITCKCMPSCSEYSILALKKYPLLIAFIKIYKRLNKTCDGNYKEDYP